MITKSALHIFSKKSFKKKRKKNIIKRAKERMILIED